MDDADPHRDEEEDDEDDDDEDGDEEEDDEDDDDEDGDEDYDFNGGGDDAVDEARPAVDGPPSRVRRSPCWPPPSQPQPGGPVWSPLFRVQPPAAAGPARSPPYAPPGPSGHGASRQPPPSAPPARPARLPPPRPGPWGATPNPVYGHRMKLFCRTGFHLSIGPKGRVTGTENPNDKYAVLEFSSVTNGEVRIRGVEANLFLAMNRQGKLYGQANIRQEGTVFVEMMLGRYNTYLSRKFAHIGWYVGIKKNGKQKPGQKTAWGQKATQFLPIRVAR